MGLIVEQYLLGIISTDRKSAVQCATSATQIAGKRDIWGREGI